MKFITYNEKFEVQLIHNMPFDSVNGLGKTEEELLEIGALVEDIPQIEVTSDKNILYKYNQADNTVTYELVDRQLSVEEQNAKDIQNLKLSNMAQDEMIDICLLATDEMYMMLEPILASGLISNLSDDNMVNFYVAMVTRNLKPIEEISLRYREEVRKILAQLEK